MTEAIPLHLSDGTKLKIEGSISGIEDVAFKEFPFEEVVKPIKAIANAIDDMLEGAKIDKAIIKFGLEVAIESGSLTAMIVKGSSKGNLEITIEKNYIS
jgi:hypothetical protein